MDNVVNVRYSSSLTWAITTDGTLWGWGDRRGIAGSISTIGDGASENRYSPVRIMDDVMAVYPGHTYAMAVTTDGTLWAWGENRDGRLGDGTTERRYTPVPIMDNVSTVHPGFSNTMAITTDGTLWAWGENRSDWRILGDGTTEDRHSPVRIMDEVITIYLASAHIMAIREDGTLWAWGLSNILGDGTTENRLNPVHIKDNVIILNPHSVPSWTFGHTIVINEDGTLWAWGMNHNGQLGDGTTENRLSPVRILDNMLP